MFRGLGFRGFRGVLGVHGACVVGFEYLFLTRLLGFKVGILSLGLLEL